MDISALKLFNDPFHVHSFSLPNRSADTCCIGDSIHTGPTDFLPGVFTALTVFDFDSDIVLAATATETVHCTLFPLHVTAIFQLLSCFAWGFA